jgi:FtsP/CotA-like multicopper oxidase with cupredoxin domain
MYKRRGSAPLHPTSLIDRRGFLLGAGAAGMAMSAGLGAAYTQIASAPDYTLRIAPLRLELAPGKTINTFGYNGMAPGPVLRLRPGPRLPHCHHQDHQDEGFMGLMTYI